MTRPHEQPEGNRWRVLRRVCIGIILASLAIMGLLVVTAILADAWSDTTGRIMATALICALWSLMTLLTFLGLERRRHAPMALITIILLAVTALVWLQLTWTDWDHDSEAGLQMAATLLFASMMMTILLQLALIETRLAFMRYALIGAGVLLVASTVISTLMVWEVTELIDNNTFLGFSRFSSVIYFPLLLTTLVALLAVPMSIRLLERRAVHQRAESIPTKLRLSMTCPGCGVRQEFSTGAVRCTSCRMGLLIEVEEPRCECGYLLYQLAGNICPECGRAVPETARWRGPAAPPPQQIRSEPSADAGASG